MHQGRTALVLRDLVHVPGEGSWSHAHSVALLVSHVSGKKTVWADELSRDKLDRFRSRPLARFSFSLRQLCQPEGITLHPPHARRRENFVDSAPSTAS